MAWTSVPQSASKAAVPSVPVRIVVMKRANSASRTLGITITHEVMEQAGFSVGAVCELLRGTGEHDGLIRVQSAPSGRTLKKIGKTAVASFQFRVPEDWPLVVAASVAATEYGIDNGALWARIPAAFIGADDASHSAPAPAAPKPPLRAAAAQVAPAPKKHAAAATLAASTRHEDKEEVRKQMLLGRGARAIADSTGMGLNLVSDLLAEIRKETSSKEAA